MACRACDQERVRRLIESMRRWAASRSGAKVPVRGRTVTAKPHERNGNDRRRERERR